MTHVSWPRAVGALEFEFGSRTDAGPVRALNEDSLLVAPPVFLVADGMGGHARGDQASASTVAAFADRVVAERPWTPDAVTAALGDAESAIHGLRSKRTGEQVGTTVAALVLVTIGAETSSEVDADTLDSPPTVEDGPLRWLIAHVGDSRVYRHDDSGLERLTADHSLVQELVDDGSLTDSEARRHPHRNVITRALGVDGPGAEMLILPASGGQTFLICSDGVCGVLDDGELATFLDRYPDPEVAADAIVAAALAAGGRDNATAVVVRTAFPIAAGDELSEITDTRPAGVPA